MGKARNFHKTYRVGKAPVQEAVPREAGGLGVMAAHREP